MGSKQACVSFQLCFPPSPTHPWSEATSQAPRSKWGSLTWAPYQRLPHPGLTGVSLLSASTDVVPLSAPTSARVLQARPPTQDGESQYGDGPTGRVDGSTWEAMASAESHLQKSLGPEPATPMALEWSPWTVRAHLPPVLLKVNQAVGRPAGALRPSLLPSGLGAALPAGEGSYNRITAASLVRRSQASTPGPAPGLAGSLLVCPWPPGPGHRDRYALQPRAAPCAPSRPRLRRLLRQEDVV